MDGSGTYIKEKRYILLYDIIFCFLALVAVYFAICDLTKGCEPWQIYCDTGITIIFIVDYIVRFIFAKQKALFFKDNILDLIAIIPFSSFFKIFRALKILRMLKLLKLVRLTAFMARFYKKTKYFFNITGLKYMVMVSMFCIIIGGIAIHYVEDMSLSDGIWWSFVTATTVGYGDLSPTTPAGRIIAAILMVVGIGLIGSLTSTITALFFTRKTSAQQTTSMKGKILETIKTQLDDFDNLSDDDINTICITLHTLHDNTGTK